MLFKATWLSCVFATILLEAGIKNITIGNNLLSVQHIYRLSWAINELFISLICSIALFIGLFIVLSSYWWIIIILLIVSCFLSRFSGSLAVFILTFIPMIIGVED